MEIIITDANLRSDVISDYLKKAEEENIKELHFIWKPRYLLAEVKFTIKI